MNTLFKNMTAGNQVYVLIKDDNLKYHVGTIVTVGSARTEMQKNESGDFPISMPQYKQVVDVTYSVDGKNYTDTVDTTAEMFLTKNLGGLALVTTNKEYIVKELRITKQQCDDYVKNAESEVPRQQKRSEQCDTLIAELDTEFAEKQKFEARLQRIEDDNSETKQLLKSLLKKMDEKL